MPISLTAEQYARARAALVIGVDDYHAYADSRVDPPSRWNLRGAVTDGITWTRTLRHLMVLPGKTEVLLAPRRQHHAPLRATRAQVLDAWERFLDRVPTDGAASVAVFAGRGASCVNRGLLFCPSDTEGPGLQNAIPLTDLFRTAHQRVGGKGIVFVFDCSFADGEVDVPWATIRYLPHAAQPPSDEDVGRTADLQIWAGYRSRATTERRIGGAVRGTLSWGLTTALTQAPLSWDGGPSRVSWSDATSRAANILATLGAAQSPIAQGPTSIGWSPAMVDPRSESFSTAIPQIHAGTMGITSDTNPPVTIGYLQVDPLQSTETWSWSPSSVWPTSFRLYELLSTPNVPGSWTREVQPFRKFNLNNDPVTSLPAVTWTGKTYTITRVVGTNVETSAGWMRVRTDVGSRPQYWYQYATEYMEIGVAANKSDKGSTYLRFVQDNATPSGPVFQTG